MRYINPPVPPSLRPYVFGRIVESSNPHDLSEDMLEVQLPNGIVISAGWFTKDGGGGEYFIAASHGLHDAIPPITTSSADQAAEDVANIAVRFLADGVSNAETSYLAHRL